MVNITSIDLLRLATSLPYANQLASFAASPSDPNVVQFYSYNETFVSDILGPNVSQSLVAETSWKAFHEAGAYNKATNSLYIGSNWDFNTSNPINVTVLNLDDYTIRSTRYANLHEANGGCAYYPPGTPSNSSAGQQLLFCDQGDFINPSQLTLVDPASNTSRVILNNYLGKNFTSFNDVIQHPLSGDLWFTDPSYGYWQGFRPAPQLRPQVYRFEPNTGVVKAVADDFVAPNGIEFSPDYKHVYVTDTGAIQYPNGSETLTNPRTIYRFDITADGKGLENRRVFAYPEIGLPDGIHSDTEGNVYSGVGDGVHVWNKEGVLLGKMIVPNGVANFAFIPGGVLLFNEKKLFRVTLAAEGRTVKRDFGLF